MFPRSQIALHTTSVSCTVLSDIMNCTARFGNCFLRIVLMYQPPCLVPCCQGKLGKLTKTSSQNLLYSYYSCKPTPLLTLLYSSFCLFVSFSLSFLTLLNMNIICEWSPQEFLGSLKCLKALQERDKEHRNIVCSRLKDQPEQVDVVDLNMTNCDPLFRFICMR